MILFLGLQLTVDNKSLFVAVVVRRLLCAKLLPEPRLFHKRAHVFASPGLSELPITGTCHAKVKRFRKIIEKNEKSKLLDTLTLQRSCKNVINPISLVTALVHQVMPGAVTFIKFALVHHRTFLCSLEPLGYFCIFFKLFVSHLYYISFKISRTVLFVSVKCLLGSFITIMIKYIKLYYFSFIIDCEPRARLVGENAWVWAQIMFAHTFATQEV